MQAFQIASQFFEVIAGGHTQVLLGRGVVEYLKFSEQPGIKIGRDVSRAQIINEEGTQPIVPEAADHMYLCTTQWVIG